MNFCSECGSKIAGEAPKFCGECGSALPIATDELTPETSQQYPDESKPLEADVAGSRDGGEQAAAAGNTDAMIERGFLAHNEGDVAGARGWWEQAAAAGNAAGFFNLGLLAANEGDAAGGQLDANRSGNIAGGAADIGRASAGGPRGGATKDGDPLIEVSG